jgi:hypothetical protein
VAGFTNFYVHSARLQADGDSRRKAIVHVAMSGVD